MRTQRQIFNDQIRFRKTERKFFMPHGIHASTLARWHQEGFPRDVDVKAFFGFDRYETAPVDVYLRPRSYTVVKECDGWEYRHWDLGFKERIHKEQMGMSEWEYALNNPADWPKFKACLNPDMPLRYPHHWNELTAQWKTRDYPLTLGVGSFYGSVRNWMGPEGISLMYYDNPDFMHEIAEYLLSFYMRTLDKALSEVDFDAVSFFEDMAFKTGPLVSPAIFREFILPRYQQMTAYLRSKGVEIILVDSDGNLDELIPLFLEAGVNGVYPLEIAAGSDPVKYQRQFGGRMILMGGVDKRQLSLDRAAIDRELDRIAPAVAAGGYIPYVDHHVPTDVPFDNFCYYIEQLKKILGVQGK
ncbi:MAG: hypothetical protein L6437_12910 [Kiritimatiellae bacterium]|nr:hypothetical protein [Kiritimatiellia bacterium]